MQALSWKSIFDPLFGGMNPILMFLGIIEKPLSWLADPKLAMPGVILVNVWAGIPFFTVNFLAGLQSIEIELYEAAEVDGANAWQKFVSISLPGIRYVVIVTVLLSTNVPESASTSNWKSPSSSGAPEMTPVAESRVRPAGIAPPVRVQV